MTKKFDQFVAELKALCKKHNVVLSVSAYDALQVWDLHDDDEDVISSCGIDDMTEEQSAFISGDL